MVYRLLRVNVLSSKLLMSLSFKSMWRSTSSPSNACLDTDWMWLAARPRDNSDVRPMNSGDDSSSTDDSLLLFNSLQYMSWLYADLHLANALNYQHGVTGQDQITGSQPFTPCVLFTSYQNPLPTLSDSKDPFQYYRTLFNKMDYKQLVVSLHKHCYYSWFNVPHWQSDISMVL